MYTGKAREGVPVSAAASKCDGMPGAMRLSRGLSVIAGEWCPSSIGQLLPATGDKKSLAPPPFQNVISGGSLPIKTSAHGHLSVTRSRYY